jgi:hypothetical protein
MTCRQGKASKYNDVCEAARGHSVMDSESRVIYCAVLQHISRWIKIQLLLMASAVSTGADFISHAWAAC